MPIPTLTGQALVDIANSNLGGFANSVSSNQLLSFINEGKDELWSALKQVNQKFFVTSSQATTSTLANYFPALQLTVREYSIPIEARDILFIEVLSPSGYERIRFAKKSMLHPDFRDARTSATAFNAQGSSTPLTGIGEYLYDIVGKSTLVLAQYPEVAFVLQIWYVRALPDITLNSAVDEIVFPFNKKIADFAVMKIMLNKDPGAFAAWKQQWRDDIIGSLQGSDRQSSDPTYATEFMG